MDKKKIYAIFNNVAKEQVSDIFTCNNDAMACYGFCGFLDKTVKGDMNDKIFSLRCVGEYDLELMLVSHIDESVVGVVARGRDEAKQVIADAEEGDFE